MLKYRLVTGLAMFFLFCLVVFWNSPFAGLIFIVLGVAFLSLALREYFSMTAKLGLPGYPLTTIFAGGALVTLIGGRGFLFSLTASDRPQDTMTAVLDFLTPHPEQVQLQLYRQFQSIEVLVTSAFLFTLFVVAFQSKDLKRAVCSLLISMAGHLYLCWTLAFLFKIYYFGLGLPGNRGLGPFLVFFVVMVTKCGDIGGYTFGKLSAKRAAGNHKLVPRLSPKKSWEGFVGSLLFSALAAVLLLSFKCGVLDEGPFNFWLMEVSAETVMQGKRLLLNVPIAVGLSLILATVGLIGDLAESVLKRAAEVKDSGQSLPGFGGALDALDSLIFIAPAFYAFLALRVC